MGAVLPRGFGLLGQTRVLRLEFGQEIADPLQVRGGVLQAAQALLAAALVAGQSGGLLQEEAPLLRGGVEDRIHLALADQRVGASAQACAEEEHLNVAQPAGHAVEEELPLPTAGGPARDRNLGELQRELPFGIVQDQHDLRQPVGAALGAPGEDEVLHPGAAQRVRALLPQHPADSLTEVALAAAVGTDDGGDAGMEL